MRADQGGFTLIEVIVAMALFVVTASALAVGSGGGLRMIGTSSGRQGATQLASREMERLRAAPYETIGHDPLATEWDSDPESPDAGLDATRMSFKVPLDNGAVEPLVVTGTVAHRGAAAERGFRFQLYRYITWPTVERDHKRVTIVVVWNGTDAMGRRNRVAFSSLYAPGSIGWGGTSTTTPVTVAPVLEDTSVTNPVTTPTPVCTEPLDLTPPAIDEFRVTGGTGTLVSHTASNTLNLKVTLVDICLPLTVQFSTDGGLTWSSWEPYAGLHLLTVPLLEGEVTVAMRAADANGNISAAQDASVIIDTTRPTTPGGFTAVPSVGNTARLSWLASTDPNPPYGTVAGYRVWRRLGSTGEFTVVKEISGLSGPGSCTTLSCSWVDDTRSRAATSTYTYFMTAFDAAGNQSAATAVAYV